jgi:hypothetical protein
MSDSKPISEFSMKNWKNLGIYITLLGLFILFLGGDIKTGLEIIAIGIIFLLIFHGPKIIKIFNKS